MSKRKEITLKFIEKLSSAVNKNNISKVKELINELHSADIAEILEKVSLNEAQFIYQILDEEKSAEILLEIDDNLREDLLAALSAKEIAEEVIENLESDDAADLIGELSEKKQEEVLSHIEDTEYASNISDLLAYSEDTAGGLMAKELIKVNQNWNTLICLREMRKQAKKIKKVHTIYVVDDNEKLLGSHFHTGQLLMPYWMITLALHGDLIRTFTKKISQ